MVNSALPQEKLVANIQTTTKVIVGMFESAFGKVIGYPSYPEELEAALAAAISKDLLGVKDVTSMSGEQLAMARRTLDQVTLKDNTNFFAFYANIRAATAEADWLAKKPKEAAAPLDLKERTRLHRAAMLGTILRAYSRQPGQHIYSINPPGDIDGMLMLTGALTDKELLLPTTNVLGNIIYPLITPERRNRGINGYLPTVVESYLRNLISLDPTYNGRTLYPSPLPTLA